jgi:NADPH-dependent curcumin reductase
MPSENRQVLLAQRPSGIPQPGDFQLAASPVPRLEPGQALVRNIYLSVDPAQRGWAAAEANYSNPVPLGTPMRALAVGVVVESKNAALKAGEFLYGWFGWQDYALVEPAQVIMRATQELPLTAFASLLGINGVTAIWRSPSSAGRSRPRRCWSRRPPARSAASSVKSAGIADAAPSG